jgi:hypothetical protein
MKFPGEGIEVLPGVSKSSESLMYDVFGKF